MPTRRLQRSRAAAAIHRPRAAPTARAAFSSTRARRARARARRAPARAAAAAITAPIAVAACASPTEGGPDADPPPGRDAGGERVLVSEYFDGAAGEYEVSDAIGDFTVLRAVDRAVVAPAADEDVPPRRGDNVFYFSAFEEEPGFRHSRIDQCREFDPALSMSFDYHVYADVDDVTDDLRVRVNPNFYESVQACEDDVLVDSTDGRLEELGAWYNEDWDIRLESAGVPAGAWFHARSATHNAPAASFTLGPDAYPEGATAVRFSVRVRDDIFTEDESRRLYLDDLVLRQP